MNEGVSDRKLHIEEYWQEQLQYPDWYIKLEEYLKKKIFPITKDPKIKRARESFYETVEAMLDAGKIPLAEKGPDFDAERKPIDTLVIHHSSEDPDIRLSKLSAIGFVRQYGLDYLADGNIRGNDVSGKPIWSGHFRDGKMVFFAYHWLIRPGGEAERLLDDSYIGWQSGDWDINTRSVAIALSGDYTESAPSKEQIAAIRGIISSYSSVSANRIFGHREINPKTTCPGNKFLGESGWQKSVTKF